HTTNSYTTFDVGFMPELLYTFFYIGSALAYLRYMQNGNKAAQRLSLACFIASLLSKETAVTLPGTLLVLHVVFDPVSQSFGGRFIRAVRSIVPHMLILFAYLAFAVCYLHVMGISLSTLLHPPAAEAGSYQPVFDRTIFKSA